ncbi:hypothetical protein ACIBHX_42655 [Nonomuraea sp. NPDC050536]|uniref:hypothetical protein n=1 Tax=Nonomuraea sp. NPDC050536 TaxID=3364366 RepID=UPI0037C727BE
MGGLMGGTGDEWRLMRGDDLLGVISVENGDFPWLSGRFSAESGFDEVKPWFDRELELVDADGELDVEAWEEIYSRIEQTVTLVGPSGPVPEFLLHISGDEAWFRWSNEPFSKT